jgi:guanylate kinase
MPDQDKTGRLLVVSGPSGSGKTTLCREAIKQTDAQLSISATTRPQGKNEIDGKDYFFLSEQDFLKKAEDGGFLEHARVFGNYYGTPAQAVGQKIDRGQTVVLEIDVQGAAQVFAKFPGAIGILVLPPDEKELKRRLVQRGRDSDDVINIRYRKAQQEVEQARADGHFEHTIVNDELETAIRELIAIINN